MIVRYNFLFEVRTESSGLKNFSESNIAVDSTRLIRLTEQLELLKDKLIDVQSRKPLFKTDSELELQEKALKKQIDCMKNEVGQIAAKR
jgi:hypothetical protein